MGYIQEKNIKRIFKIDAGSSFPYKSDFFHDPKTRSMVMASDQNSKLWQIDFTELTANDKD